MAELPATALDHYERFSLYNSPYPAHDAGCAIDLYSDRTEAIAPVSGTVLDTRTVRCPDRPYAVAEDSLILVDCGAYIARILHVDPDVEPGEEITTGESLGRLVRSGFFGRWVDNHVHLGFRRPEQNLYRASGSLPIDLDVPVTGIEWDGTGTVTGVGPTHIQLDSPSYGGRGFAALASDEGVPLDGGLPHYGGGGAFRSTSGELSFFGTKVGSVDGRTVTWRDVVVSVDDRRATGLSLFASRGTIGAKIVFHEGHGVSVGDRVQLNVEPTDDPIRLG